MIEPSGEGTPSGRGARQRRSAPANWGVVVSILIVTCIAMLGAIYWVVQTGKL